MTRLRKKLLSFLLSFALILGMTSQALAQSAGQTEAIPTSANKIGTHLVQGDYGAQAAVVDKLNGKSLFSKYPVVVMMNADDPAGANVVATALKGGSYAPIVRVNITPGTDASKMQAVAAEIQKDFPKAPVMLGNEINNQTAEWTSPDYTKYGVLFNALGAALGGSNPLGIAALDVTNGQYDAASILPKILGTLNKGYVKAIFAHVYVADCAPGFDADRCNTNAGKWIVGQMGNNGVSGTLYIDEFGTTKCGANDFDCLQDFYEKNNGVQASLVVGFARTADPSNPGNSSGVWYHAVPYVCEYWEPGSLTVHLPKRCGGTTASPAPMYLFPGIDDQPTQALKRKVAANYTLMCGSQLELAGNILNEGQVNNPTNANYVNYITPEGGCPTSGRCVIKDVVGTAYINYENTTIPLFRLQGASVPDPERSSRRIDDLEGFFSSSYTKQQIAQGYDRLHPLANGVAKKLLPENVQCTEILNYLQAIQKACSVPLPEPSPINNTPPPGWKGQDSNRCALDLTIPTTQYTYTSLLGAKPGGFSCDNLKPLQSTEWYKAFVKVETTMPKGFKPAYIIEYINLPKDDPQSDADIKYYSTWFTPQMDPLASPPPASEPAPHTLGKLRERIRVIKVYVPTGFSLSMPISPQAADSPRTTPAPFNGGFMQVIKAIIPINIQKKVEDQLDSDLRKIISRMQQLPAMLNPSPVTNDYIRCNECVEVDSQAQTLESLLVSRINAEGVAPAISSLEDPTCAQDDFAGEKADQRKQQINPSPNPDPVHEIAIPVKADLRAGASLMPLYDTAKIRTYLLLPEEYRNITNYESDFLNSFLTNQNTNPKVTPPTQYNFAWQQKGNESGKRPWKYLQLNDTAPKNGAGASITVSSPVSQGQQPIGAVISLDQFGNQIFTPVYLKGAITGPDLEKFDINPQVPGGKMARAIWELVCNITRPHDPTKKTVSYKGLEPLLTKGISACTEAASKTTTPVQEGISLCSGTTQVPPPTNPSDPLSGIKQLVQQTATANGIPTNLLWGIINIEGSPILRAARQGQSSTVCSANGDGSVGPLQLTVASCRPSYDPAQCVGNPNTPACKAIWDTYNPNSGANGITNSATPCNLQDSLTTAAKALRDFANNFSGPGGPSDQWYRAAGLYNGLCVSNEQQSAGACNSIYGPRCSGAPSVQGCSTANYCTCANEEYPL